MTLPLSRQGRGRDPLGEAEWEGEGRRPVSLTELRTRARWMRLHPTEAERRLWSLLRNGRIASHHFRRQKIIFPFIVDFVCLPKKLIIEADGPQHADDRNDERRSAYLIRQGFRVLRFWNNEVLAQPQSVAEAIHAALEDPHPPAAPRRAPPSPLQGEGLGAPHA